MSISVLSKARWVFSVMAVTVFSALVLVGCTKDDGDEGGSIDPNLVGSWTASGNGVTVEFKFSNDGVVETFYNDGPFQKGTYSADGSNLSTIVTHIYGDGFMIDRMEQSFKESFGASLNLGLSAQYYSLTEFFNQLKNALKPIAKAEGMSDAEFEEEWNEEIEPQLQKMLNTSEKSTYSVNGDILVIRQGNQDLPFTRKNLAKRREVVSPASLPLFAVTADSDSPFGAAAAILRAAVSPLGFGTGE